MEARRKKMLSKQSFEWWTHGHRRSILQSWECVNKMRGIWKLHELELTLADWNAWQAAEKTKNNVVNKESALYKELFPNG